MEKNRSKSWVGNIYHKFEVVCHEVDGFVTKDTVKYVGANMKKLYSGVVQDFLIPLDDHVKPEAQAVNGKTKHAVGTYTSSVSNNTQNLIKEQSCLDQYADNSLECYNASTSTELDGVVASEEAEIDVSVGNKHATATCKNSFKVFKKNITREVALVDEESNTSEEKISSEYFSDDDNCFSDVTSSHTIIQDDMVWEEWPLAKGSSSFLDNLSKSQLRASMNEKLFISSPDTINCISDVPSSQMVLQRNITSEVQSVADQANSFGDMALSKTLPFSMEESHGNSVMTKLPHPTSLYDTKLGTFPEDDRGCNRSSDAAESIPDVSITQTNLQDNITSVDVVSVSSALSNTPSFTDFSEVNASSSLESFGNAGSVQNDLEWCPGPQLKVLMCPAKIGCMNESSIDFPGMETIDLTDEGKLKESCVLIDSKLHNRVSFRPRKYKSYKELIQEAFASRKRLIKEYKQLAVLYADVDVETSQHSQLPSLTSHCLHPTESSTCNICEPGWEIL